MNPSNKFEDKETETLDSKVLPSQQQFQAEEKFTPTQQDADTNEDTNIQEAQDTNLVKANVAHSVGLLQDDSSGTLSEAYHQEDIQPEGYCLLPYFTIVYIINS